MSAKTYFSLSGLLFFLIFILHAARLIQTWEAVIGGVVIPMWASWVGIIISGYLAFCAFKLIKS